MRLWALGQKEPVRRGRDSLIAAFYLVCLTFVLFSSKRPPAPVGDGLGGLTFLILSLEGTDAQGLASLGVAVFWAAWLGLRGSSSFYDGLGVFLVWGLTLAALSSPFHQALSVFLGIFYALGGYGLVLLWQKSSFQT